MGGGHPHHKRTGHTEESGVHCSKSRECGHGFDSIWAFSQNSNAKGPTLQTAGSFPLGNQQTQTRVGLSQVPGAGFPQETNEEGNWLGQETSPQKDNPASCPQNPAWTVCICPQPLPSSLYLRQKDPIHVLPAHPRGHSQPLLEKPPGPAFSSSS